MMIKMSCTIKFRQMYEEIYMVRLPEKLHLLYQTKHDFTLKLTPLSTSRPLPCHFRDSTRTINTQQHAEYPRARHFTKYVYRPFSYCTYSMMSLSLTFHAKAEGLLLMLRICVFNFHLSPDSSSCSPSSRPRLSDHC